MVAGEQRPAPPSRAEHDRRAGALRELLEELELDGALTFGSTMRPGPLVYLAGYAPTNGFAALYINRSRATLLTDQPWDVGPARERPWLGADAVEATDRLADDVCELLGAARRVGVVGWEDLPVALADALRPSTELVDIGERVARLRSVKSAEEVALLREACTITSAGAAALAAEAAAGVSERELAAAIEGAMRRAGSAGLAFPLVLGAGSEQTASAVPLPSDRALTEGDLVLLDCGATYHGYCGDMARTLVIGRPSSEQRRMLDTARHLLERCAEALGPGARANEIHQIAAAGAADAGFELPFLLGHGIGTQNWEPPLLGPDDDTELAAGMVVTVEPGLYVPGLGGVRLENTFLITASGAEPLTFGPIDLWES